jgi:hypothetical protein
MADSKSEFMLIKQGMRQRTREAAFRSVLRIYFTIGMLVAAGAFGYFLAKTLDIKMSRAEAPALIAGAVGLTTALISHLTVRLLSERDTLRSALYLDSHVFMRILTDWARFEQLASVLMGIDTRQRPTSARGLIQGLLERGIIAPDDAEKLDSALFMRNAIAHGRLPVIARGEAEIAASQLSRLVATLTRVVAVSAGGNDEAQEPTFPSLRA